MRRTAIRHRTAPPGRDQHAQRLLIPEPALAGWQGEQTALHNLVPLCGFHHQIAIHRWGWELRLNNDGTTAATSPDRTRTLHSHGPPRQAA